MTFQRIALLSLCLLSACTPITPTPDAGPANTPPADPLSEELTRFQGQARTVEALAFDRGFPATVVAAIPLQGDSVLTRARDYLSRFGALYGQAEPLALEVRRFDPTEDDGFVTFHQTLSGVPVWGAELAVFVTGSELRAAVGRLLTSEATGSPAERDVVSKGPRLSCTPTPRGGSPNHAPRPARPARTW